ncbi:MAG: hypothetical protein HUU32_10385 [Calditrichaceae bacterium]|nr:hypothetical protein [Calditrichia bacterium]NUQ41790.1 hypothetical protein [Calditrichaceae bacterium]
MVKLLLIVSWPLVRIIVPVTPESNSITSPDTASAIACRSEPAPLSSVLLTVIVAAESGSNAAAISIRTARMAAATRTVSR